FSFAFLVLAICGLLIVMTSGILPLRSSDLGIQVLIAMSSWIVFAVVMLLSGVMRRHEAFGLLALAGIAVVVVTLAMRGLQRDGT
ncbi:MAG TPA: hypothetical protein VJU79_05920, partial [Candidatus Dormibacteraeota bacterium]|nr:hypothetical protein [Candidatus Dormibacteraeota bacterium]